MSSKTFYSAGAVADSALSIVGTGNSLLQDKSVTMGEDAKIVGADNVDSGGSMLKLAENAQLGGYRVGENGSLSITQMDETTRQILDQAITMAGANANNMMTLAAGRDANEPLADESVETTAGTEQIKTTLSGLKDIFTPWRLAAAVAVLSAAFIMVRKGKRK